MRKLFVFVALLALASLSCGDDEEGGATDASDNVADANGDTPDADPNAPDADPNAPDADLTAPDASTDTGGIACGTETCTVDTQECCIDPLNDTATCVDPGQCQAVALECDGPEDCTGNPPTFCCVAFGGGGGGVSCNLATQCQQRACHTNDDCPMQAPECCDSGGLFPVDVCRPTCFSPTP